MKSHFFAVALLIGALACPLSHALRFKTSKSLAAKPSLADGTLLVGNPSKPGDDEAGEAFTLTDVAGITAEALQHLKETVFEDAIDKVTGMVKQAVDDLVPDEVVEKIESALDGMEDFADDTIKPVFKEITSSLRDAYKFITEGPLKRLTEGPLNCESKISGLLEELSEHKLSEMVAQFGENGIGRAIERLPGRQCEDTDPKNENKTITVPCAAAITLAVGVSAGISSKPISTKTGFGGVAGQFSAGPVMHLDGLQMVTNSVQLALGAVSAQNLHSAA